MRRRIVISVLALTFLGVPSVASADVMGRTMGLGVDLGDPSGITFKWWLNPVNALDFTLAFDDRDDHFGGPFQDDDDFSIHVDYLWHWALMQGQRARMDLYAGVGPVLGFFDHHHHGRDHDHRHDNEFFLGVRGPVGLDWAFNRVPIDVFVEVALGLAIIPDFDFFWDGVVGIRGWFP